MKLADLEVFVVANAPPGWGGRYFIFVKLTTACGIVGYGEVYAGSIGPAVMRSVIHDLFSRYLEGENPENIELMFRRVYSSGFSQRPDPTLMGAFSGMEIAYWDIIGKALEKPIYALLGVIAEPVLADHIRTSIHCRITIAQHSGAARRWLRKQQLRMQ